MNKVARIKANFSKLKSTIKKNNSPISKKKFLEILIVLQYPHFEENQIVNEVEPLVKRIKRFNLAKELKNYRLEQVEEWISNLEKLNDLTVLNNVSKKIFNDDSTVVSVDLPMMKKLIHDIRTNIANINEKDDEIMITNEKVDLITNEDVIERIIEQLPTDFESDLEEVLLEYLPEQLFIQGDVHLMEFEVDFNDKHIMFAFNEATKNGFNTVTLGIVKDNETEIKKIKKIALPSFLEYYFSESNITNFEPATVETILNLVNQKGVNC